MRRMAANILATIHAVVEIYFFYLVFVGDLFWATAVVISVVVPMLFFRGRCWLTILEIAIRGRRVVSMTRRLMYWISLGFCRNTRYWQWWLLGGTVVWWIMRVLFYWKGV